MSRKVMMFAALMSAGVLMGCEEPGDRAEVEVETPTETQVERDMERTGESIERTAERTGESIERGAERTGEAIQDTGQAMRDSAQQATDDARTAAERTGEAVAEVDHQGIYSVLAETVEAGVKPGTFNDMIERFSEQDRDRFKDADGQTLSSDVQNFSQAWNAKFGSEFDINDPQAVFGQIVEVQPSATGTGDANTAQVTVRSPGGEGSPVNLTMVRDGNNWRIDLPDQQDPQALQNALQQHYQTMSNNVNEWSDPVQAQQRVAYNVLSAIAGSSSAGMQQPGASQ